MVPKKIRLLANFNCRIAEATFNIIKAILKLSKLDYAFLYDCTVPCAKDEDISEPCINTL